MPYRRSMERVGPQDASFFYLETPNVHQHVGGLQVLDPSTRSDGKLLFADVVRLIQSRLHLVPRFRQRAVRPPLPVALPMWLDDPEFDIAFHVRRAALPAPGGRTELQEFVQRVFSRPLDHTKPLWELYVIEGMQDGLAAVLTKVHHAMIDGAAAMDIASVVFDTTPEPRTVRVPPWRPQPWPSSSELMLGALRDEILHPLQTLASAARLTLDAPARAARVAGGVLSGIAETLGAGMPAPLSPLNRPIGPNRRFAMTEAPLQEFKDIKNALGGTVNDVVLASVAGGLHRWLRARHEPVRSRTLRAMVPVSVRLPDDPSGMGNRLSSLFVDLPVGSMGAKRRLAVIREETKNLKESRQVVGAEFLMNIGAWAPPTIHALAARVAARARFFNLVVSNVPGPQVPLYVAGAKLLGAYPLMPLAGGTGLSVAVTSLAGTMAFGLVGDWDTLPDIEVLATGLAESIEELRKAAGR
jgi:WS/DGAT/MGAT family acyltransferase